MSMKETRVTVDATYDLRVKIGDPVRRGEAIYQSTGPDNDIVWPATGRITSIEFDPQNHEFVITIKPA